MSDILDDMRRISEQREAFFVAARQALEAAVSLGGLLVDVRRRMELDEWCLVVENLPFDPDVFVRIFGRREYVEAMLQDGLIPQEMADLVTSLDDQA